MDTQQPVIIVGAGIAGLSIAYELQKKGIPYQILEAGDKAGGVIRSMHINGFELDAGPNSIGATQDTISFLTELGLKDVVMEASAASKNRFLVRNGQLHSISPNPMQIIKTSYISGKAKWRLFTESFRKADTSKAEESVSSFVNRRFGPEIMQYLFDPVLSGIYAGNPDKLAIQEVLPVLPRWEREYGSVTKGMMKNKGAMGGRTIIAFKGGNEVLTDRLVSLLQTPVQTGCRVTGIVRGAEGYILQYEMGGQTQMQHAARVIFTAPSYATGPAIATLDAALGTSLAGIHYPHMGVLHLGFGAEAKEKVPEGFGFLVPHAEHKHFLGAICNSAIFPGRAPEGKVLFTVFVGGARQEDLFEKMGTAQLQETVVKEFMAVLGLTTLPEMQQFSEWKKAIPQLNVGFAGIRTQMKAFEQANPGLVIAGNYATGVSIPAIITEARAIAARI
jgi:oxygen-dependent protoporphyrinogen oxidase